VSSFARLEDVILDEVFPEVDLALRRGRHIVREEPDTYAFLVDAQDHLEPFYRRFGCELIHKSDGYFYLLPSGDKLGRRQLTVAEMVVGQALTLLYLDPETLANGGLVERERLLSHLATLLGTNALVEMLLGKKKHDERVAAEAVRAKVADAIRKLALLGFCEIVDTGRLRLRSALLRFVDPLRDRADKEEALAALVQRGELAYTADTSEPTARQGETEQVSVVREEAHDEQTSAREQKPGGNTHEANVQEETEGEAHGEEETNERREEESLELEADAPSDTYEEEETS
jgi:chromosome partition protein MukE